MILLGLVSMAAVFGMPYLMDNSKSDTCMVCLMALTSNSVLTRCCCSGSRTEEGVGGKPEEQPDEQYDGRPTRSTKPHEQLRHGRVLGWIVIEEQQRGLGCRVECKKPEGQEING